MLDGLSELNQMQHEKIGDPETLARIEQLRWPSGCSRRYPRWPTFERPESTFKRWGEEAKEPGKFQNAALMARRLVERGVRFVQIYHRGWDVPLVCARSFARASQGCRPRSLGIDSGPQGTGNVRRHPCDLGRRVRPHDLFPGQAHAADYGRDHHPRCYSLWMAGGGIKGGVVHGETDDFSYNIVKDPVHIRDYQATILQLFGIDHERFTHRHQGLDAKLTGVEPAKVVKEILA